MSHQQRRSPKRKLTWIGGVTAEGGPLIVTAAGRYADWTGAVSPEEGEPPKTLHYWGQFTAQLPKKFHPNGKTGHQHLKAKSPLAARALVAELDAFIRKKWKGARAELTWHTQQLQGGWELPDGQTLFIELKRPSPYRLACDALDARGFALRPDAVFWDLEGSGFAHIARGPGEVLLMRQWIDDDAGGTAAKAAAVEGSGEKRRGRIALNDPRLVVAWSPPPFAALRLVRGKRFDAPETAGVGAVVPVRRATWDVFTGAREAAAWSCRWLRLRVADSGRTG